MPPERQVPLSLSSVALYGRPGPGFLSPHISSHLVPSSVQNPPPTHDSDSCCPLTTWEGEAQLSKEPPLYDLV